MNDPLAVPKECFIICPIGEPGSAGRKRSDQMLQYLLKPVLEERHYSVTRADMMPKVGMITSQIINAIFDSDLVIADLTGSNPNVFYELALRHASGRPYIQIIQEGDQIPFDIHGVRTLSVDHTNLDSVDAAKKTLTEWIVALEQDGTVDSPVSIARNVKALQSNDELAEKLLEIESTISDLRTEIEWDVDRLLDRAVDKITDHVTEAVNEAVTEIKQAEL